MSPEETRKRSPESDATSQKRLRMPVLYSDDDDDFSSLFPIEEDSVAEIMKLLQNELSSPSPAPPPSCPYTTSPYFVPESCGPLPCDNYSSIMASLDLGGISISYEISTTESTSGFPVTSVTQYYKSSSLSMKEEGTGESQGFEGMNGGDDEICGESDDEWLERVLNLPPPSPLEFEDDDDVVGVGGDC